MVVFEQIDAVNDISEEADNPLVRAVINFTVFCDRKVFDPVAVLPFVCFLQGTLQAILLLCSIRGVECKVGLPASDAPEQVLLGLVTR